MEEKNAEPALAAEPEEEEVGIVPEVRVIPDYGTAEWLQYCSELDGHLPTPIDISITGSINDYYVPELKWYNYDVYPQKIKITNTGYTVVVGAKWPAERPYIEGGPLLEKHILSQIHFHWGNTMMEGSDHVVDQRRYPGEMQMNEFRKLMNPWDEPILRNFRPIKERQGRHVFLFKPHWCLYNSLLPIPAHPEPPITVLSPVYINHPELLPKQNAYMLEPPEEAVENIDGTDAQSSYTSKSQTSRLT